MLDKERLKTIGKFLNDRMIIHRNVENNSFWTTEEKMIQELYDNYLDLLIEYNQLKDKLNAIIEYIKSIDYDYLDESNQHNVVEYLDSILNRLGEEKLI